MSPLIWIITGLSFSGNPIGNPGVVGALPAQRPDLNNDIRLCHAYPCSAVQK
jgi:hypothetical protein